MMIYIHTFEYFERKDKIGLWAVAQIKHLKIGLLALAQIPKK